MTLRLAFWLLLDNFGNQGTCARDTGNVAGLADQILHDGQNPELIPGILQSRENTQSAKGLRTTTDPVHDDHRTGYPEHWFQRVFNGDCSHWAMYIQAMGNKLHEATERDCRDRCTVSSQMASGSNSSWS